MQHNFHLRTIFMKKKSLNNELDKNALMILLLSVEMFHYSFRLLAGRSSTPFKSFHRRMFHKLNKIEAFEAS